MPNDDITIEHIYTDDDCIDACDMIASQRLTLDEALDAYRVALIDDPTESLHAAHVRDAIRDNYPDATI